MTPIEDLGEVIDDTLSSAAARTSGEAEPLHIAIELTGFEPADQRGPMDFTDGPIAENE